VFCDLTESLLSVKKARLLASLDSRLLASVPSSSAVTDASDDTDAEFAAFQVTARISWYFVSYSVGFSVYRSLCMLKFKPCPCQLN